MSDTPRTDAVTEYMDVGSTSVLAYVPVEFASTLECENTSLREQLRLAQEQLEDADKLIAHAVQIMEPEQVGQWTGVRAWQESWRDEIAPTKVEGSK